MATRGAWRFHSNVNTVIGEINTQAPVRMRQAVELVRGAAMRSMQEPKTGRQYRVPGTGRMYTASAPGEAPAVRLGRLIGSVKVEVVTTPTATEGRVGTTLEYGEILERRRNRPFLNPAFIQNRDRIRQILGARWM